MSLSNATKWWAEAVPYVDFSGKEIVLAIVKATFELDDSGKLRRAEVQSPVRLGDENHFPDAEDSSVRYPSDVVPEKVGTDVVFVGSAVLRKPGIVADVAVRARERTVSLRVHGERLFYKSAVALAIGPAAKFEERAIVYEYAYGGKSSDLATVELRNPVGRGVRAHDRDLEGKPAPCIEDPERPIESASDRHPPAGYGAIPMHWSPRLGYAGTYDAAWMKARMPLPPRDVSPRFGNVAPERLQFDPPLSPGERIAAFGMCREGLFQFDLPSVPLALFGVCADGSRLIARPHVDTVLVEPARRRVELTLRHAFPKGRGPSTLREIRAVREMS